MGPGSGAIFGEALHLLLILAGVHRLPETVVQPGVKGTLAGEVRKNLRLEAVASPVGSDFLVENEEAGVDPGIANDGLLAEAFDLPVLIELERAKLRVERDRSDRSQSPAGVVEVEEGGEVDVAEAVSIGGEELVADMIEAGQDTIAGIGFDAGVEDFDIPVGKATLEVVEKHLLAMAGGEDKAAEALASENLHEMDEDRTSTDWHHGLGKVFGKGIDARSLATAKNDDFEIARSFYFSGHADSMKRM